MKSRFEPGHTPWNKDKSFTQMIGNKYASVGDKASANTLRWRARQIVGKRTQCEMCKKKNTSFNLVVHHIDDNPANNVRKNLQVLCRKCHINHHRERLQAGRSYNK